ncbi:MAG: phage holin family protein [Chloroflexales bacterium]
MLNLILTWIVSAVSLIIITRLDVGVSVRSFDRALVAALVIGLVNAVLGPILGLLALPLTILSVGLFALVINALLFWLAAAIVSGFYLRNGFWSALIGSLLLSLSNAIIFLALGSTRDWVGSCLNPNRQQRNLPHGLRASVSFAP